MTFFVMGILIGLLLLVLEQRGGDPRPLSELADIPEKSMKRQPSSTAPKKTDKPVVHRQTGGKSPAANKAATDKPVGVPHVEDTPAEKPIAEDQATGEKPRIVPLSCDRKESLQVRERARTLASISEQDNVVQLVLTRDWEYYSPGHRRGFVEAFSEADRCLHGHFRELHFLYQGQEVATVSTIGAVEMK
jgi:hypothetical protein